MTVAGAFASALLTTLVTGGCAYFVAKHYASRKIAGIAAFWLTFGAAGGRYSFSGPATDENMTALGAILGASLALIGLWRWLIKRHSTEVTNDSI